MRLIALLILTAFIGVAMTISLYAETYEIERLTYDTWFNVRSDINDNGWVTFRAGASQEEMFLYDIFLYDGFTTRQITSDMSFDNSPQINDNGQIVWRSGTGNESEIFFFDGISTKQITTDASVDWFPIINDSGYIAWQTSGSSGQFYDNEIMLYDGFTIKQLSDNMVSDDSVVMNDRGWVAWRSDTEHGSDIMLYDGVTTKQISSNVYSDNVPAINDNGWVAWRGYNGFSYCIFLYDGSTVKQVADVYNAQEIVINNNGYVAWKDFDGNDDEIYLYTGTEVKKITDNQHNDERLQINDNNYLVWDGGTNGDQYDSIYVYDGYETQRIIYPDGYTYFNSSAQINNDNQISWTAIYENNYNIFIANPAISPDEYESNRKKYIITTQPDTSGNVYRHFIDEDWSNENRGRVDREVRQVADSDGAIAYEYFYHENSNVARIKYAYGTADYNTDPSNPILSELVAKYEYDINGALVKKTLSAAVITFDDVALGDYGDSAHFSDVTISTYTGAHLQITDQLADGFGNAHSGPNKLSVWGDQPLVPIEKTSFSILFDTPIEQVSFWLTGTFHDTTVNTYDKYGNLLDAFIQTYSMDDTLAPDGTPWDYYYDRALRYVNIEGSNISKLTIQPSAYDGFSIDDLSYIPVFEPPSISTFDSNDEGWIGETTKETVTYQSAGGNSGGFLTIEDLYWAETAVTFPPSKFMGDLSELDGGLLSYDLILIRQPTSPIAPGSYIDGGFGRIQLNGVGANATFDYTLVPTLLPSEQYWTTYYVPMTAEAWNTTQENWEKLLSNVTSCHITLDIGGQGIIGLDNFNLEAVPGPDYYESKRKKYIISIKPDVNGNIYRHYIDEDWGGQGNGRPDKEVKEVADENGAKAYQYFYHENSNVVRIKYCYETADYTTDPSSVTFSDKVATYEYDLKGRVTTMILEHSNADGELVFEFEYYGETDKVKSKHSFKDAEKTEEQRKYEYDEDGFLTACYKEHDPGVCIRVENTGQMSITSVALAFDRVPYGESDLILYSTRAGADYTNGYFPALFDEAHPLQPGQFFDTSVIPELTGIEFRIFNMCTGGYNYGMSGSAGRGLNSIVPGVTTIDFYAEEVGKGMTARFSFLYGECYDKEEYYRSGMLKSKLFFNPDADGCNYYEYLDEDYNGQGFGKVSKKQKQDGSYELAEYWDNTDKIKSSKKHDKDGQLTNGDTYYASGRKESLALSEADASGNTYYHYIDEDWNGQSLGRVDQRIASTTNGDGEIAFKCRFGSGVLNDGQGGGWAFGIKSYMYAYSDVNLNNLVATYEVDANGSIIQKVNNGPQKVKSMPIYMSRDDGEAASRMELESTLTQGNSGTNYTQTSTLANPPNSQNLLPKL